MLASGWQGLSPQNWAVLGPVHCQPGDVAPLSSAPPTLCREKSKKKKKKLEKQVKGKGDKKGATSKSSSSRSPAKGMSDSFKSKEFVSSDESSSAESKKEVGVTSGGGPVPFSWGDSSLGGSSPSSLGSILVISAGEAEPFWYLMSVVLGNPSRCPQVTAITLSLL